MALKWQKPVLSDFKIILQWSVSCKKSQIWYDQVLQEIDFDDHDGMETKKSIRPLRESLSAMFRALEQLKLEKAFTISWPDQPQLLRGRHLANRLRLFADPLDRLLKHEEGLIQYGLVLASRFSIQPASKYQKHVFQGMTCILGRQHQGMVNFNQSSDGFASTFCIKTLSALM